MSEIKVNSERSILPDEYWELTRLQSNWFFMIFCIYIGTFPSATEQTFLAYLLLLMFILNLASFICTAFSLIPSNDSSNQLSPENLESTMNSKAQATLNHYKREKRKFLHYANHFPGEHPFISMSIVGILFIFYYQEWWGLHSYYLFGIILLFLSDYIYHIQSTYLRRTLIISFVILFPLILGVFVTGLIAPLFIVSYKFATLNSLEEYMALFQNPVNFMWSIFYPYLCLELMKIRIGEKSKKNNGMSDS